MQTPTKKLSKKLAVALMCVLLLSSSSCSLLPSKKKEKKSSDKKKKENITIEIETSATTLPPETMVAETTATPEETEAPTTPGVKLYAVYDYFADPNNLMELEEDASYLTATIQAIYFAQTEYWGTSYSPSEGNIIIHDFNGDGYPDALAYDYSFMVVTSSSQNGLTTSYDERQSGAAGAYDVYTDPQGNFYIGYGYYSAYASYDVYNPADFQNKIGAVLFESGVMAYANFPGAASSYSDYNVAVDAMINTWGLTIVDKKYTPVGFCHSIKCDVDADLMFALKNDLLKSSMYSEYYNIDFFEDKNGDGIPDFRLANGDDLGFTVESQPDGILITFE